MNEIIQMPRLGTNDDYVVIGQWLIRHGEYIKKDQAIAILETTKETSELLAPKSGFLEIKADEEKDIAVGEVIAVVQDTPIEKNEDVKMQLGESTNVKISLKAKELIKQHNIDISLLPTNQIIREKDVVKLIKKPYSISPVLSNKLLVYGGGGGCKIILDILKQRGNYKVQGVLDRKYPGIKEVLGVNVIGDSSEDQLQRLFDEGYYNIANSVIFNGKKHGRKEPYEMLKRIGFNFVNIIHNSAIMEPTVDLGEGNVIAAGAIIGSEAVIGSNCFINAGAIISHDCIISDHCHIASGAILGGNVIVGENTLIGQGCTIFKDVKIGNNVVIVNGSHVFRNIPDNSIYENGEIINE